MFFMASDLSINHFELFGLPVHYAVDTAVLTQRFRDLQQTVHPDKYAHASDQEKRLSMQKATQINEAYQVLKDPLQRARYILTLNDVHWDDEQETVMDPAFLMEQMELREALEDVRSKTDPLDEVGVLLDDVQKRIRGLNQELETSLEDIGDDTLQDAKDTVRKLQFLYKLRQETEDLEADLEDEL